MVAVITEAWGALYCTAVVGTTVTAAGRRCILLAPKIPPAMQHQIMTQMAIGQTMKRTTAAMVTPTIMPTMSADETVREKKYISEFTPCSHISGPNVSGLT